VVTPTTGDDWLALNTDPLPVGEALVWAAGPGHGAQVSFCGVVRDHSAGRSEVTSLEYEAYEGPALEQLGAVAAEARRRWPELGRLVMVHRLGRLTVGEIAVLVVVTTPHRHEAFAAARFCIDTLKATVPIWKYETWADGADWSTCEVEDARHADGAAHSHLHLSGPGAAQSTGAGPR
jgi:molybdopterin synthase catalytic subunit